MPPQVAGGRRSLKSAEKMLAAKNYLPGGMVTVPGAGAKLDAYGNMSRGQLVQLISALLAFPKTGYNANRVADWARKRAGKTQPQFFVGSPGGGVCRLAFISR